MWKWLEQYFTFTKGERNAVIVLVVLAMLIIVAPKAYFYFKPVEHIDNSKCEKEIADFTKAYNRHAEVTVSADTTRIDTAAAIEKKSQAHVYFKKPAESYFVFDPNKIGVAEWMRLGFTEKQAMTIEHYKDKGAKFYKPTDLKRLFVMTDEHYDKLLPYVKIDVAALPERNYDKR